MDQGPLQEWWSAALRADAGCVLDLARSDPADRADLLVRVDTPIPVLAARLEARGLRQSRLEGGDSAARVAELEYGNTLLGALFDQLVYSPGVTPAVLQVGGLDDTGVAAIVAAVIEASGSGGVQ